MGLEYITLNPGPPLADKMVIFFYKNIKMFLIISTLTENTCW